MNLADRSLVASLGGSCTLTEIKALYRRGGIVCGTSAGAAALTELTMAGGEIDEEGNLVEQYIGPGLGLLGFETIVDTHFQQRRRLQRLFVVIDRLITQGTRSERGNRWCERIWTVLATCNQQGRSVFAYLEAAVSAWFQGDEAPSLLPQES